MREQWDELKETIIELRDNNGTATQQEVCQFLVNLMNVLEAQIEDEMPTADVVEVMRCGECKWWKLSEYNTFGIHVCQKFSGVRGEHDFCSRGEKKDE